MAHEWVLHVLTDLRNFAHRNGLVQLSDQLEQASRVAAAEIAGHDDSQGDDPTGDRPQGSRRNA